MWKTILNVHVACCDKPDDWGSSAALLLVFHSCESTENGCIIFYLLLRFILSGPICTAEAKHWQPHQFSLVNRLYMHCFDMLALFTWLLESSGICISLISEFQRPCLDSWHFSGARGLCNTLQKWGCCQKRFISPALQITYWWILFLPITDKYLTIFFNPILFANCTGTFSKLCIES
jgi:hypothetical protein